MQFFPMIGLVLTLFGLLQVFKVPMIFLFVSDSRLAFVSYAVIF